MNDEATFYVETVSIEGLEELYLRMLMTEDGTGWDRSFVEGVLSPQDVAHVYSISIGQHQQPGQLIWHFNSNGFYSVKSGYILVLSWSQNLSSLYVTGPWDQLWAASLPPKIKDISLPCLRNFLPTKKRLIERGINMSAACASCGEEESLDHVLLGCSFSKSVWQQVRYQLAHLHVVDFIVDVFSSQDSQRRDQVVYYVESVVPPQFTVLERNLFNPLSC